MNDYIGGMNTTILNLFGKHQDPMIPVSSSDVISTKDVCLSNNLPLIMDLYDAYTLLRAENCMLKKALETSELEKQKLLNRARQNSSNSNKPPSTDSPYQSKYPKEKDQTETTPRPFHPGASQKVLASDREIPERLNCCPGCGGELKNEQLSYRRQYFRLVEKPVIVEEYQCYKYWCPHCQKWHTAPLPQEVAASSYDPKISAFITELCGIRGVSRRDVEAVVESVLNIPISQGGIQKVLDRSSKALEPVYEDIAQRVRAEEIQNIDETTWYRNGKLEWLWLMRCSVGALYRIDEHRSSEAFHALIGDWHGTLVSDGYGVYKGWDGPHQYCLAHALRKARFLKESPTKEIAKAGTEIYGYLKTLGEMQDKHPTENEWNRWSSKYTRFINKHLDDGDDVGELAKYLYERGTNLMTFLHEDGVPATNNMAEQSIRTAVIWRKNSYGSRNKKGEEFVERILTLKETCMINGKKAFNVLVDAIGAFFKGERFNCQGIFEHT